MTVQLCIMPAENCAFKAVMILSARQERHLNSATARGCKRGLWKKKALKHKSFGPYLRMKM